MCKIHIVQLHKSYTIVCGLCVVWILCRKYPKYTQVYLLENLLDYKNSKQNYTEHITSRVRSQAFVNTTTSART